MQVVVAEFDDAAVAVGLVREQAGGVIDERAGVVQLVGFARHAVEAVIDPGRRVLLSIRQRQQVTGNAVCLFSSNGFPAARFIC